MGIELATIGGNVDTGSSRVTGTVPVNQWEAEGLGESNDREEGEKSGIHNGFMWFSNEAGLLWVVFHTGHTQD